jgi:hypothetical protein
MRHLGPDFIDITWYVQSNVCRDERLIVLLQGRWREKLGLDAQFGTSMSADDWDGDVYAFVLH